METKIKHLIKPFLALLVLVLFSSCQKEEHEDHAVHEQNVEQKYEREEVPFRMFQENFLDSQQETALTSYLAGNNEAAFSDYLLKINRERIVAFTNENVKTYTFNVVTSDTDSRSFTNLILYENDEGTGELLLKYTPTTDWIEALSKGNKKAFSGEMSIMDKNGNVQQTNSFENGVEIPGKTVTPCTFTVDVIWIDCYGAQCPCTDGGGYAGGWDITYDCPPTSGGGGGGGPNSGGSGPNGGGSGDGGYTGDLPTDPVEWALFMNLKSIIGPNDSFSFDNTIDEINSIPDFETFEDFESYMNNPISEIAVSVELLQDGTHDTRILIRLGLLADLEVFINQTLKSNMINRDYYLNSLAVGYTGMTIGSSWETTHFDFDVDGEVATINVYGELDYNLFMEGIGTIWTEFVHYEIKIDTLTGNDISVIKID